MPKSETPTVTIEQLRKKYEELNNEHIRADANYKNAKKQLDELKATALETYGTDDLDTLRNKLQEMEAENAKKLSEYQSHLEKIDADLKAVNQKFSQTQASK